MKEMLKRALRTFLQAAVGYVVANVAAVIGTDGSFDVMKSALMGLGVSAVAAGLAAIMNLPPSGTESGNGDGNVE